MSEAAGRGTPSAAGGRGTPSEAAGRAGPQGPPERGTPSEAAGRAGPQRPPERGTPSDPEASALEAIGLRPGEEVRFRRADRARWQPGVVHRLERDGSLRITDVNGAARAVPFAHVQVRVRGSRHRWEPAADRAGRAEQLRLAW